MPATHSFSLTPKASKFVRFKKYPRYLGGASKMVSDAIEWYWTENVVTTGAVVDSDNYEQDPITMECVACGAKHYKRELRVVGDLMMNIEALQEHLAVAYAEIEELKNRKIREIVWSKISGSK